MLLISSAELQGSTRINSSCGKAEILCDAFLLSVLCGAGILFLFTLGLNFWAKAQNSFPDERTSLCEMESLVLLKQIQIADLDASTYEESLRQN